jgi:hypothetical protein
MARSARSVWAAVFPLCWQALRSAPGAKATAPVRLSPAAPVGERAVGHLDAAIEVTDERRPPRFRVPRVTDLTNAQSGIDEYRPGEVMNTALVGKSCKIPVENSRRILDV